MPVDRDQHGADVIKEIGLYSQKVMVTLNAGGILAILTFIANVSSSDLISLDLERLKFTILGFVFGLFLVGVSLFATYASIQCKLADPNQFDTSLRRFIFFMTAPLILSFLVFLGSIYVSTTAINLA